ncbi:MAG: MBL fold metallo-hydrolase [Bacteroidota bacterium]|nr:MBL fold metallo-hydrolase [Ferruginibacter sp.]
MKRFIAILLSSIITLTVAAQRPPADQVKLRGGELTIQPIMHASLVLAYHQMNIYVDPTGGGSAYKGMAAPDVIIITDIHGDHFDLKTIDSINTKNAVLVVPKAVADKLPATMNKQKIVVLNNGETTKQQGVSIKAIPMYNLPEEAESRHPKGRGNGYVLTIADKNIYISGDTEDIPEMRALTNIDIAFVCMNLPYTMDVTQASQGVLAFKPAIVYPYHHRGQDINTFKSLVNAGNASIDVRLREWYGGAK